MQKRNADRTTPRNVIQSSDRINKDLSINYCGSETRQEFRLSIVPKVTHDFRYGQIGLVKSDFCLSTDAKQRLGSQLFARLAARLRSRLALQKRIWLLRRQAADSDSVACCLRRIFKFVLLDRFDCLPLLFKGTSQ